MDLCEAPSGAHSAEGIPRHPWEIARRDFVFRWIGQRECSPSRLLDIGCGDCYVLFGVARRWPDTRCVGLDVALTDKHLATLRTAAPSNRPELYSSLDAVPTDAEGFDTFLMLDVLEHIEDDIGFMRTLRQGKWLGVGAVGLVTVPAFSGLWCARDKLLGHYRRHTTATLARVCEEAGWSVEKVGYLFTSLLPLRVAQVTIERIRRVRSVCTQTSLTAWNWPACFTQPLRFALTLDAALGCAAQRIGITIPGLSCYAQIRK